MPLGPEDVIRKSFKSAVFRRGYDGDDVDLFLEEIVAELRRRELEREDLLGQLMFRRSAPEGQADRIEREREQLELIRMERRELVNELKVIQARLNAAQEELDQKKSATIEVSDSEDAVEALEREER